jgi:hypothetical protein
MKTIRFFTFLSLMLVYSLSAQSQNQNPTQNVCAGSIENYNVTTSLTGSTFAWSIIPAIGGTGSSTTNSIDITWGTTPGTYTVQVVETSADGCVGDPKTVAVTVIAAPTANAGTNQTLCAQVGTTINLSGTVANAISQSWTTTGTAAITNATTLTPSYTFTSADIAAGSVSFTLTATGNAPCLIDTSTVTYTLTAAPTLTVGNNGPVCEGSTLSLSSTNIAGATYSWTGPGGFVNSTQNPTVSSNATTAMAGTYSLTVSGITGGCPDVTGTTTVVVNPKPATSSIWHN